MQRARHGRDRLLGRHKADGGSTATVAGGGECLVVVVVCGGGYFLVWRFYGT